MVKIRVFKTTNNIILQQYKKNTNIVNFSGKLDIGYNIKIKGITNKNKKLTK